MVGTITPSARILRILVAALLLVPLLVILPTGQAAQPWDSKGFGSQVGTTDAEFVPHLDRVAIPVLTKYCRIKADGSASPAGDLLAILNILAYDSRTTLAAGDFVVKAGDGYGRGDRTFVHNADTAWVGRQCDHSEVLHIVYADVNSNGRYDNPGSEDGDGLYLSSGSYIFATDATEFSYRLFPVMGEPAGAFVGLNDDDRETWGSSSSPVEGARLAFQHLRSDWVNNPDDDRAWDVGDWIYVMPSARGDNPRPGAFALNGPQQGLISWSSPHAWSDVEQPILDACIVDNGDPDSFTDNHLFLVPNGATSVQAGALRLVGDAGALGSVVSQTHTADLDDCDEVLDYAPNSIFWNWADVDATGHLSDGDWTYLGTTNQIVASEGSNFTLRLSDTSGGNAGTFVQVGDADLVSYGSSSRGDRSHIQVIQEHQSDRLHADDQVWVRTDFNGGLKVASIRIDDGGPGDLATRDNPFVEFDTGYYTRASACRMTSGSPNPSDHSIHLNLGAPEWLQTSHLRLIRDDYGGPGSLVQSDHPSLGEPCDRYYAHSETQFLYADVDSNGYYDHGDYVYFTSTAGLAASTATEFAVRLTAVSGAAAGTLVKAGDQDLEIWAGAVSPLPSWRLIADQGGGDYRYWESGEALWLTVDGLALDVAPGAVRLATATSMADRETGPWGDGGSDGADGDDGDDGPIGDDGQDGADGADGSAGDDGYDGADGTDGDMDEECPAGQEDMGGGMCYDPDTGCYHESGGSTCPDDGEDGTTDGSSSGGSSGTSCDDPSYSPTLGLNVRFDDQSVAPSKNVIASGDSIDVYFDIINGCRDQQTVEVFLYQSLAGQEEIYGLAHGQFDTSTYRNSFELEGVAPQMDGDLVLYLDLKLKGDGSYDFVEQKSHLGAEFTSLSLQVVESDEDVAAAYKLVISVGVENVGAGSEGEERVIPVTVTAYEDMEGVRLKVLREGGAKVETISPPMDLVAGQSVEMFIRVTSTDDVPNNGTVGQHRILLQAVAADGASSGGVESNVETLRIIVTDSSNLPIPAWGAGEVALALAGTAMVAAFRHRRDAGR